MIRRAILAVTAAAMSPLSAASLTAEQGAFARNFAMLVYAEDRCPKLHINMLAVSTAASEFGLPKGALEPGGAIAAEASKQIAKLKAELGSRSDEDFCAFMEDGFGSDGLIAPGFIKRR